MNANWSKQTKAVHGGSRRSQYGEVSEALYLTQGFVYDSPEIAEARFQKSDPNEFIYARYGNPTVRIFEERIALIEGAEDGFATASGMAAVSGALMSVLKSGDRVVAARALFGSCLYVLEEILTRYGVEVELVDGTDLEAWRQAITPATNVVFFETISNPVLEVVDVTAVSELAHSVGALVIVDNVFTTPVYSQILEQGVDLVVYSSTKHMDGQGRCLGGVILGSAELIRGKIEPYMKHTGGAMSPFNAWVMLKGLETMQLRVRAQTSTANALISALEGHAALSRAIYPGHATHPQFELVKRQLSGGAGTVIALDFKGGQDAAFAFLNALQIPIISNNLGDTKTIVTHPATTTHQRLDDETKKELGITPGLVRVSLGIEDESDLISDFKQALDIAANI